MKTSYRHLRRALALAALPLAALAQTTPAPVAPTSTRDESPIELSPFVVTTDKDVGYLAANTMSGSRLNTPLVDTPASITEMTKEFLEDIGATEMMNAVEYAMGFQSEQSGANPAYRRTLWNRRVDMRLQLNVQNLLDNRDLIWTSIDATNFQKNDYSLFSPRQFILSASFSYR